MSNLNKRINYEMKAAFPSTGLSKVGDQKKSRFL
jgi:hypothetical protein